MKFSDLFPGLKKDGAHIKSGTEIGSHFDRKNPLKMAFTFHDGPWKKIKNDYD